MRNYITIIVGILLLVTGFFGAKHIIDNAEKPKAIEKKVIQSVYIETVQNADIPITLSESGRLMAKNRL